MGYFRPGQALGLLGRLVRFTNKSVSWTDIYPCLSEEMLDAYQSEVTPSDEKEFSEWFAVQRVFNPKKGRHLVSTSFFQRSGEVSDGSQQLARPPQERFPDDETSFEFSLLLEGIRHIGATRPQVVFRVYLAVDLEMLVAPLVEAGCEVFLMNSPSCHQAAARMWRFLALEEDRWTTFTQPVFGTEMIHDVERSEEIMKTDLGFWRSPRLVGSKSQRMDARSYRPIDPDHFGSKGGLPAGLLMRALIWHCRSGTMETRCVEFDGSRGYPVEGSKWPSDKFAEWFLLAAVFPRVAFDGVFTFLIWQRKTLSHWYALDIEYVTWANPGSEVLVSHKTALLDPPWSGLPESSGITVREDTDVFRRGRPRIYQGSRYPPPGDEIQAFTPFHGSLRLLLEWTSDHVATSWWVDLNPILKASPNGAELFLDRCHASADVVVSGYYFVSVTEEIARWAERRGLDPRYWKKEAICKVPKLEGPLTLWRTSFSRRFLDDLAGEESYIGADVLLLAWMQEGAAVVSGTSAEAMGWRLQQNP